jgi:hypothetical protein
MMRSIRNTIRYSVGGMRNFKILKYVVRVVTTGLQKVNDILLRYFCLPLFFAENAKSLYSKLSYYNISISGFRMFNRQFLQVQ